MEDNAFSSNVFMEYKYTILMVVGQKLLKIKFCKQQQHIQVSIVA